MHVRITISLFVGWFSLSSCDANFPDGVYVCTTSSECPPGLSCRSDGLCYRSPEDAGSDAALPDAGPDAALPDAGPEPSCDEYRPEVSTRRAISMNRFFEGEALQIEFAGGLPPQAIVGTPTGILLGPMGSTWELEPLSSFSEAVDTLFLNGEDLFVGTSGSVQHVRLDGSLGTLFDDTIHDTATAAMYDAATSSILVGTLTGSIFKLTVAGDDYTVTGYGSAGEMTPITGFGRSDSTLFAGTGLSDRWLEQMGTETNFDARSVSLAFWPAAIETFSSPSQLLLVGGEGDSCTGVYVCAAPCDAPTILGNSALLAGPAYTIRDMPVRCHVVALPPLFVAASTTELWYSPDAGATFYLVENDVLCGGGTINDIRIYAEQLFLATSDGVYAIPLSELVAP